MPWSFDDALQNAVGAAGSVVIGRGLHRPVDQHRASHNGITVNEAPIAAVQTTIAIVAHGEVLIFGYHQFAVFHMIQNLRGPLGTHGSPEKIAVRGWKVIAEGILVIGIVDDVRLIEPFAVDVNLLVDDANAIAGQTDHAFYVVRMVVKGKFENDDIATANGAVREDFLVPSAAPLENEFVDQQMIPH